MTNNERFNHSHRFAEELKKYPTEMYSGLYQTSKRKSFAKIVNGFTH